MAELSIHRVRTVTVSKEYFPQSSSFREAFWVMKILIHSDSNYDEVTLYINQKEEPEINME